MNTKQLKAANPIERVAARYGSLQKAGANFKMLCPFHDDHHPSLMLHVGRQFFKCHACGAGGDVIGLVMGMERCSFAEAVKKLGGETHSTNKLIDSDAKVSVSPPERRQEVCHSHPDKLSEEQRTFLRSLLPFASGHSELSPTWLDFGVGLAPSFVPDAFRAMRGRIIFPIYDAAGVLTGFGARRKDGNNPAAASTVPASDSPKYINSANNALFDKSRTLYGIHRATEAIRREGFVFLVEGYKDVLAMHAAGYCNTVALCGTALTDGQAEILARYTSCLYLLLDGDLPGRNAAAKIARERKGCFTVRPFVIPTAEDPDELFRRLGKTDFRTYIRHLTAEGRFCARRLLGYCLLHPSLAPHLTRMLEADDMPFPDSDYNDLLRHLSLAQLRSGTGTTDDSSSGFPPELAVFASFPRSLLPALLPPLPDVPGVPEGMLGSEDMLSPEAVLHTLCLEYYEERIMASARRLRNHLHCQPASSRPPLLHAFGNQLRLLSEITRQTCRTAAVGERWF